ncbi:ABC transporter permease [Phaeobacter italicus]|jgi:ribose transport system permease protein|uniref:ABC transporter permease n=1 Tax=Phaeobacter italicus TaxID=481446 RepID=UPI001C95CFFB|nr:ABC transporter permease [Phaeobacter italicus]MBY6045968.1 ABC transporter permease [Phaeobacter italicus]
MTDTGLTQAVVAPEDKTERDWFEIAVAAALPVAIALLAVFFYIKVPVFMTANNWIAISVQVSALMTISIPFALLLMAGKIDLSVGSTLALCGVVAGLSFEPLGIPGAVVLTLVVGTTVGLINGVLVASVGMSPIIVTLGTLTLIRGLAQWLAPNPIFGFPEEFLVIGYERIFGLPVLTWIMLAVILVGAAVMALLPIGPQIVALGVNKRAAFLVGLRVRAIGIGLYAATGFFVAVAALMSISRINSAPAGTLGIGVELSVLTAVLLGGIPFTGGKGSVLRVVLGVWLLGMLSNGLILMNVPTELSLMTTGLVLVVAAGLDVLRAKRS